MKYRMGGCATLLAALAWVHVPPALAADGCSDLLKFAIPGGTIQKAQDVPAGPLAAAPGALPVAGTLPAHCRIDGIIGAHTGRDGNAYGIRFALAMPAQW